MHGAQLHEPKLRQLAFHNLPSLMSPEKYIYLPLLPLNANGKTDRKALQLYAIGAVQAFVSPATA
jgi:hypothetical protein